MNQSNKVIIALDLNDFDKINKIINLIKKHIFGVKIGYQFFFNFGLEGYKKIQSKKINIFLDLKLHDIPNTVEQGLFAISKLNPYFTTVHISGGDKMLKATNISKKNIKILGVTSLTSLNDKQTKKYYSRKDNKKLVRDFTKYALQNKIDGIVCSPLEIKIVKKIAGKKLIIITPGIRPSSYVKRDDQKRVMSPGKAISFGADYLVIGRPITEDDNPVNAAKRIGKELSDI